MTRRDFLTACLAAGGSAGLAARAGAYPLPPGLAAPGSEGFPWRRFGDLLRARFRDLRRHFVFDYYPWYAADPFRHWTQWDRVPPGDLAANTMPNTMNMPSVAGPNTASITPAAMPSWLL